MTFEYLQRVLVDAALEIDDIGNCAIIGRNDVGEEFYLLVRTTIGETEVIEYGPCRPDIDLLPTSVILKYDRWEWSEYKLEKRIDKFLNDPKKAISQADLTTPKHIKTSFKNPLEVLLPNIEDEDDEDDN